MSLLIFKCSIKAFRVPIVGCAPLYYGNAILKIAFSLHFGVEAETIDGLTGIWVGDRKIGSIGVHVSRGVTTHGLAINVNNDLQPFEWVVPCGVEGCRVTSLGRELGAEQDLAGFAANLAARYGEVFDREVVEAEIGRLELDPGTLAR